MLQVVSAPAGCRVFHQSSHSLVAGREAGKQRQNGCECVLLVTKTMEAVQQLCYYSWITHELFSW